MWILLTNFAPCFIRGTTFLLKFSIELAPRTGIMSIKTNTYWSCVYSADFSIMCLRQCKA